MKEERGSFSDYLLYNSSTAYTTEKSMLLSAVYRCVEVISDSVAQLPLEPYKMDSRGYKVKFTSHPTYKLLNKEPNQRMSRFTFIKTLIVSTLLRGNGYAYIERDGKGDAVALHLIPSELVTINRPKTLKEPISYSIAGLGRIESKDMIHILNFSYDGIIGISTLQHARHSLGLATDSDSHAAGFFKGGANIAGILKSDGHLAPDQKQQIK